MLGVGAGGRAHYHSQTPAERAASSDGAVDGERLEIEARTCLARAYENIVGVDGNGDVRHRTDGLRTGDAKAGTATNGAAGPRSRPEQRREGVRAGGGGHAGRQVRVRTHRWRIQGRAHLRTANQACG